MANWKNSMSLQELAFAIDSDCCKLMLTAPDSLGRIHVSIIFNYKPVPIHIEPMIQAEILRLPTDEAKAKWISDSLEITENSDGEFCFCRK